MRRSHKVTVIIGIAIVLIIIISIASALFYFNDRKLAEIARKQTLARLGCDLELDGFHLDGISRLDCQSIKAHRNDTLWFEIKKLVIEINPWAILNRKIMVRSCQIDSCFINAGVSMLSADTPVEQRRSAEQSGAPYALPLVLEIRNFKLSYLNVSDNDSDFKAAGAFNLSGHNIVFKDIKHLTAEIEVNPHDFDFEFRDDSLGLSVASVVDGDIGVAIDGIASALFNGDITIRNTNAEFNGISFTDLPAYTAAWDISVIDKLLELKKFTISAESLEIIKFKATIDDIYADSPNGALTVQSLTVDLADYQNEMRNFLPGFDISGKADLESQIELVIEEAGIQISTGSLLLTDIAYSDGSINAENAAGGITFSSDNNSNFVDLNFNIGRVNYDTLSFKDIALEANSVFDKKLSLINSEVEIDAKNIYQGALKASFNYAGSALNSEINMEQINLSKIVGEEISGLANALISFGGSPYELAGSYSLDILNLNYRLEDDSLLLDSLAFKGSFNTSARNPFEFNIVDLEFAIGDLVQGQLAGRLKAGIPIVAIQARMEASSLPQYLPAGLISILGPMDLDGDLILTGMIAADTTLDLEFDVDIEPTDMLFEDYESLVISLGAVIDLITDPRGIAIGLDGTIGEFYAENLSSSAYRDVKVKGEIIGLSLDSWLIESLEIEFPGQKVILDCGGSFYFGDDYSYELTVGLDFRSDRYISLTSDIDCSGIMNGRMYLKEKKDTLYFDCGIDLQNFDLKISNGLRLNQARGSLPFTGKVYMGDSLFIARDSSMAWPFSLYRRSRYNLTASPGEISNLTIGDMEFGRFQIKDFKADIAFNDGVLAVKYFEGGLLTGAVTGSSVFDFSKVNFFEDTLDLSPLGYQVNSTFSNIDFDLLVSSVKGRKGRKTGQALLGGNLAFRGTGLPLAGEEYFLEGLLDVTDIGSQTADRLLKFMDPLEENPGVARTRKLMNRKWLFIDLSYQPTWFSFSIKHGNLYPRLYMDQPFFADIIPLFRISMPIQYGRIPLNTVLKNISEQRY